MEKHQGGATGAIEKHHEREKEAYQSNPDIDLSRSADNFHIKAPEGKYYYEVQRRIEAAKCRVRKDSVRMVNTYTVTYDANGGADAPANGTKTYDVSMPLSDTEPTRTGYIFLGWNESKSAADAGTATYTKAGTWTYTANAATTLYAVWVTEEDILRKAIKVGIKSAGNSGHWYDPATFDPSTVNVDENLMQDLVYIISQKNLGDLHPLEEELEELITLGISGDAISIVLYGLTYLLPSNNPYEILDFLDALFIFKEELDELSDWPEILAEVVQVLGCVAAYYSDIMEEIKPEIALLLDDSDYKADLVLRWVLTHYVMYFDRWNDYPEPNAINVAFPFEDLYHQISGHADELDAVLPAVRLDMDVVLKRASASPLSPIKST